MPVRGINVAERKGVSKDYLCLRDELWFRCREWFESRECTIPDDGDFMAEVTGVEYDFNSLGKKYIKDKRAMGWSPDLADAFVLTFASSIAKYNKYGMMPERQRQKVAVMDSSWG